MHDDKGKDKGKGYNEIVIFEDIPYEFTIGPNEKAVYQVHTKQDRFYLEMSTLLPVDICMTEKIEHAPFPPNCQESERLTGKQLLDVQMEEGKIGNIGVHNNNNKTNKFKVKFYALNKAPVKKEGDGENYTAQCLPALTGKVAKYNMKANTSACYNYFLPKIEDTELILDVVSGELDKVNVVATVGDDERLEVIGAVHIFSKAELERACKGVVPCQLKIFIDSKISS